MLFLHYNNKKFSLFSNKIIILKNFSIKQLFLNLFLIKYKVDLYLIKVDQRIVIIFIAFPPEILLWGIIFVNNYFQIQKFHRL